MHYYLSNNMILNTHNLMSLFMMLMSHIIIVVNIAFFIVVGLWINVNFKSVSYCSQISFNVVVFIPINNRFNSLLICLLPPVDWRYDLPVPSFSLNNSVLIILLFIFKIFNETPHRYMSDC